MWQVVQKWQVRTLAKEISCRQATLKSYEGLLYSRSVSLRPVDILEKGRLSWRKMEKMPIKSFIPVYLKNRLYKLNKFMVIALKPEQQ